MIANSVKCLLEVNEVVVTIVLVLYMFWNYDSAVEDMFNCTPSFSEACSTLLGWLVKLMVLHSWHCLWLPFFGMGIITGDLVNSVGHFSVPRSSDIDMLVFLLSFHGSPHYLSVQRGRCTFQATCLLSLLFLLPLQYRRTVFTFIGGPVGL